MSQQALEQALEQVFKHEGGFSNHPMDRGGRTNMGVTQDTLNQMRSHMSDLPRDVRNLNKQQVAEIYRVGYWNPSGADILPWPINYIQLDAAIQHAQAMKPKRVNRWLQEALGFNVHDGIVGPITRNKIKSKTNDWKKIGCHILFLRADFYIRILSRENQSVFANGWANRLKDVWSVMLTNF